MTNTSLWEHFGLADKQKSVVSRLIKDVLDTKLIKPLDPGMAPKYM